MEKGTEDLITKPNQKIIIKDSPENVKELNMGKRLFENPCDSPLAREVFYKTFKIFGIIIHVPAFWRRRTVKGIDFPKDDELYPFNEIEEMERLYELLNLERTGQVKKICQ